MRRALRWNALIVWLALLLPALACSGPAPTPTVTPTPPQPIDARAGDDAPVNAGPAAQPSAPEPIEAPSSPEEMAPVALSVEGSTIVLEGDLDVGFYARFLAFVRDREDQITTLRVNSGGGVTDEGWKLGHWIFDHKVDVVVDGLCFSSCANYIFTAGKNKTILADSIVGWHGSEQQDEHIARGLGLTVEELLAKNYDESVAEWGETPTPEGRKRYVEDVLAGHAVSVREEQEFLAKIGVSVDALIYGFLPDQFQNFYVNAPAHIIGWTFSIEDMASFGIDNVTYAGDGDYPSERAKTEYGVVVLEGP